MRPLVLDPASFLRLVHDAAVAVLTLPYEFRVVNVLFEDTLPTSAQQTPWRTAGMRVVDVPGDRVLFTRTLLRKLPALSTSDAFSFAIVDAARHSILLTDHPRLIALCHAASIEAQSFSWLHQEFHKRGRIPGSKPLTPPG